MQIILLQKLLNLGNLGDIIKVKDGYARNFLIPKKYAKLATKEEINKFESHRIELEEIATKKLILAISQRESLTALKLSISQKAGIDGRLFGSVTNSDISKILKNKGFSIEKSQITFPNGPLKRIGSHLVHISLHTEIIAHITISIINEYTQ